MLGFLVGRFYVPAARHLWTSPRSSRRTWRRSPRRQACGAHRKHGDDRDAHRRAADVPAAPRLNRRNLARMGAGSQMTSGKNAADSGKQPTIIVADDPADQKGDLKFIGGSQSDKWNTILADQAVRTLWLRNSDQQARERQYGATVAGLIGIGPRDELEGMIGAQLLCGPPQGTNAIPFLLLVCSSYARVDRSYLNCGGAH
jgi:hypothetical protein